MEIQKRPALCPACGTRYRVPENALHKIAPCLKCGQKFKIVFEDEPLPGPPPVEKKEPATADASKEAEFQETNIPELESWGFILTVADDRLSARIIPPESMPDSLTLEALKEYILQKGIVYGLIKDDDLTGLMNSQGPKEEGWLISQGPPPRREKTRRLSITLILKPIRSGPFGRVELSTSRIKEKFSKSKQETCWPKKSPWSKKFPGKMSLG